MQKIIKQLFSTKTNITVQSFKKWNFILFGLYLAQVLAILVFSSSYSVPMTLSFLTTDTLQTQLAGHPVTGLAMHQLWSVNLASVVALLLFVAMLAHLLAATVYRRRYEAWLEGGVNYLRWKEYALGSGIILAILGMIVGVYDVATLALLFIVAALACVVGLGLEKYAADIKQLPRTGLVVFAAAAGIVGLLPWLVLAGFVAGANVFGGGHVPAYVYWLLGSTFLAFIGFGANAYLYYMKRGRWASYLYAERWYMILSLVVKTSLAWQLFAAILRP
jgi:hypothetical protein